MGNGGLVLGITDRLKSKVALYDRRVAWVSVSGHWSLRISYFSFTFSLSNKQDLAWSHDSSWYAAITHSFVIYEDLSNRPARSLVASITVVSSCLSLR